MRHRLPNRFLKDYTGEYRHKRYECRKEEIAQKEEQETALAVYQAPRFFDINALLSNTGERNYCLQLLLREKGKLITYLHGRGASEDQIAATVKILEDITKK
jgi:hypothetical protein